MGGRRIFVVKLLVLVPMLVALAGTAAAAKVPTTQTFNLGQLGITFTLPSDWGGGATGLHFHAVAPGPIAQMDIVAIKTTVPFKTAAANVVRARRAQLAKARNAAISTHSMKIGTTPAVQVTDRYYGLGISMPAEINEYVFLVEHGGLFYIVTYSTTQDRLAQEKPIFAASIRSMRFINVA